MNDFQQLFSSHLEQVKHLKGNQYQALCPLHNDTNPSFFFESETGLWSCKGCDATGNAPQFAGLMGIPNPNQYYPQNGTTNYTHYTPSDNKEKVGRVALKFIPQNEQ